ncbi:MAG: 3-hydroxyacyl-CoA dehydrogenase NAD-binding domain-containing protein, partial [Gracilimonas sp.]
KGNYPAPPKIIDAVEYGYKHGIEKGLENESRLFGELGATQESRNLVNLFFGMTASKKIPQKDLVKPVQKIGILGAGLMGSGIAEVSIDKGDYRVLLKDQSIENAAKGEQGIWKSLNEKAQKRIISDFERDQTASKVTGVDSYKGFESVDLVIEAVFEDLDLKRKIVAEVESETGDECIFASNTSSLPISEIAKGAKRPENILGMHYFSPVQKMPLLEIITTDQTADWVIQTAFQVGVNQGKNVIVVGDGPGFYTTRILAPYMNEAMLLLEEGASIEFLDKIMKDFGFPVGPMALFDEVGIDVGAHVAETMSPMFAKRGVDTNNKAQELLDAGYKGRKNKRGMYKYSSSKKKEVNTEIYEYFGGSNRKNPDKETAQLRMVLTMINEAAWCLEEGILKSPEDGNLGAILGLGFPPFLGGPFRYIDQTGVQNVADQLNEFSMKFGPRFKPTQILLDYAKEGKSFHK